MDDEKGLRGRDAVGSARQRPALTRIIECVPNFSEGRRPEVVSAIASEMASVGGVRVLDVEMDAGHNRAVVTLVGEPEPVVEAAFRGVRLAAGLIDMEQHRGGHPRIGAADVVPLVPLRGVDMSECVKLARRLGQRIGEELAIPVYLYGEAALRPERRELPAVRRGEYEGLKEAIGHDPERRPDFGPPSLGPAGATAVGARQPLIAFNVNIASDDLDLARAIARSVRESGGGLPAVRAIAVALPALKAVQVSMNLTDYRRTSLLTAFQAVAQQAAARGVSVLHSEIVGLVPREALPVDAERVLGLSGFTSAQILEERLGQV